MLRRPIHAIAGTLLLCLATCASAQEAVPAPPEDTRAQYPPFLANSFFSINVGYIHYRFSEAQLEPGYHAESIEIPHAAARIGLFGHQFSKYLAAQATYMRPVRYVSYLNLSKEEVRRQVPEAFGGVTLTSQLPLTPRISLYGEGGLGVTSRAAVEIGGKTVIREAHFASGLLGAGVEYHVKSTVDFLAGVTYSPGRKHFNQPATRLFTTGFRYNMRPLPPEQVADNQRAGFSFPANVIRFGYTTNLLTYGPNKLFSEVIPVFWGGVVETRRGYTFTYERNVFHTKKRFAFDLGASASYWRSNGDKQIFRTLSVYPMFRFILLRKPPADVYFNYSLAGPSYISRVMIDESNTGARFTFQDFIGVGAYFGKKRRLIGELGIKHFSNGNIFTRNASVKVPLTLSLGWTF